MVRVLFICMGNICRSPTAEAVFRHVVEQAGLADKIRIDSAGTHGYHVGEAPDRRALAAARQRGYRMDGLCARQVDVDDFAAFDYVLAMDKQNLAGLKEICPRQFVTRLHLFMRFSEQYGACDVPDPYYGGTKGFETVLDMVEDAARGLLRHIVEHHLDRAA